jgi:hypothetical protein
MNEKTIFVSIASYRDIDVTNTIDDLFERAKFPNRIIVGLFIQDTREEVVRISNYTSSHPYSFNIKFKAIEYNEAKGAGWARDEIMKNLFSNEDYFLCIDSHSRFLKEWDEEYINQLNNIPTKGVISVFPQSFDFGESYEEYSKRNITTVYIPNGLVWTPEFTSPHCQRPPIDDYEKIMTISAGNLFGKGEIVDILKTDEYYNPVMEQEIYSLLLFKSGYDIYAIRKNIIWHKYITNTIDNPPYREFCNWSKFSPIMDFVNGLKFYGGNERSHIMWLSEKYKECEECFQLKKKVLNKVSCVMTTYRRFNCVERSISMFLNQDYENKELIIYNTDTEYPISLDETFKNIHNIKVINNNIDFETKKEYDNTSSIRRDAKFFADGDYYITWDDDDIFFPWNISQCVDGIIKTNSLAWKPYESFMKQLGAEPLLYFNYLEASFIVKMDAINKYGFKKGVSGPEHLGWFEEIEKDNKMKVDKSAIPGYCFYWSDTLDIGGHKQSNYDEFQRPDNFQRHKEFTTDYAKRKFTNKDITEYKELFQPFLPILMEFENTKPILFNKYILPNLRLIG